MALDQAGRYVEAERRSYSYPAMRQGVSQGVPEHRLKIGFLHAREKDSPVEVVSIHMAPGFDSG
ncbi:MAG: hypothetical protein WD425_04935 [Nitrospirales bacterium]